VLVVDFIPRDPVSKETIARWKWPDDEQYAKLSAATKSMKTVLDLQVAYMTDYLTEMQNELLGEIFEGKSIGRREGGAGELMTVSLANHQEYQRFIDEEVSRRQKPTSPSQ
jgi:hypothetical protein